MVANPKSTTKILAYLKEPERSAMGYENLASQFPGIEVTVASTPDEAANAIQDAEILITIGNQLGANAGALYRQATNLRWVQSFGTGVDNISDHPDLPDEVAVTRVYGLHGPQMSEAAFVGMLAFARHIPATVRNQDNATWAKLPSTILHGKTAGILGLGAIASDLAPRCRAFGMRVVGITSAQRDVPGFDHVYTTENILDAAAEIDYFVVLTPYSRATHHLVGAEVFRAMKTDAILVNLARGGVVDEDALLAALDNDELAGAAMDVFAEQPLPAESRFWSHPRVFVTPHAGGFHTGYPALAYSAVAENVARYLEGGVDALQHKV